MNLQQRIELLVSLGKYMLSKDENLETAKREATIKNSWFAPEFIDLSIKNIVSQFLQKDILEKWTMGISKNPINAKSVGIIMAGNIPLVGFYDFLSVFISGHSAKIKTSSKDEVLIKHLVNWMTNQFQELEMVIQFQEILKICDAYIATGGNSASHYFQYYFGKYPHIFRSNKTSVAIISGDESIEELEKLADDVHLYFGLGCRNVTKLLVPENYDFIPILTAFKKYGHFSDHHKYKNNYDYNLAIQMLNSKFYMTNGSILLVENTTNFSPAAQLNYEYYNTNEDPLKSIKSKSELQCIIGKKYLPFGEAQCPSINDYADGADVLQFLTTL